MLWIAAAFAADEETIALPDPEELPSALEDDSPIDMPEGELEDLLSLWQAERRQVWGGRTIVRPLVSMRLDDQGGRPLQLGASIGRQWWQLREGAKATVEAVLTGEAALASGAGSYAADLTVLGGTNVGLLGFQLGPSLVLDRTVVGDAELERVLAVAPVAGLTLDLRWVQLTGSAAPRLFVAGDRAGLGLFDEPVVRAGLGVAPGVTRLSVDWTRRWTALGPLDRVGVGFRFRL